MKPFRKIHLFLLFTLLGSAIGIAAQNMNPDNASAAVVRFSDTDYIHRWSKDDQHEFTPRGQENLDHWADMVTINYYRDARDGEALSSMANSVLENYKSHHAIVVRTDSVPRTPDKPAEYLIVVMFPTREYLEAAFARFKIVNGAGLSVVYSHREYGQKAGDPMSAWLKKNGVSTEKTLMGLEKIPPQADAKK